jgi:hypothetical protein
MRVTALVAALALAACGDVGTAERLSSKEALDGIDVPTIGTVGDYPDPAHRTVVNVTRDGQISIEGRTVTFRELQRELKVNADRSRMPSSDNPSRTVSDESVVLRADGSLRWDLVEILASACCEASIWRVFIAVRHTYDGNDGAMQLYLAPNVEPESRVLTWEPRPAVYVHFVGGSRSTSPSSLYAAVPTWNDWSARVGLPGARWDISIDARLSLRSVLALLDALARARAPVRRLETVVAAEDELEPGPDSLEREFDSAMNARSERVESVEVREGLAGGSNNPRPAPSDVAMPATSRMRGETVGLAGLELVVSRALSSPK